LNTHLLALQLMALQGCLGAFDTVYHHELTEALPQHHTAQRELSIHTIRAIIYSALFLGLSAWTWNGFWTVILFSLFTIEIALTLWDFVIEDQTRLLPATERITHTILAINGGAFIALLALNMRQWFAQPAGFEWQPHGYLSVFLALCGVGVGLSAIRDAFAVYKIGKQKISNAISKIHFSDTAQRVLITGATGFVGQLLVRALLNDGHEVIILTRYPKQASWLFEGKVNCFRSMEELTVQQKIDVIVNLAGARILGWRWTEKRKKILRQSRIGLTQNVIDWIAKAEHKPRLLLSASAIGYYGIQKQSDTTDLLETSTPQHIFMSQLCQAWEKVAQTASTYDVNVICMRFGLILGNQGALPTMLMPIKLGLGGKLGTGHQWVSWIHVQDVLRAIAHLMQQKNSLIGAYNFTAPENISQEYFSKTAAKILHRPCFFSTPGFLMRLLLGEQADLLLEGQKAVPARLQVSDFTFTYPDLISALKNLV